MLAFPWSTLETLLYGGLLSGSCESLQIAGETLD